MTNQIQIYAIHGFLGKPKDWQAINPTWKTIDPYSILAPSRQHGLVEWGNAFNQQLTSSGNFLLGYSLGGRLAMHALLTHPHRWKGAILVSTHSGLTAESARHSRTLLDEQWANSFEKMDWKTLMLQWNAQSVFQGDLDLRRIKHHYCRKQLAETLRYWSLGRQQDLLPQLQTLHLPILWLVGSRDTAACQSLHHLHLAHPKSKVSVAPEVGHRVPWGNISFFKQAVEDFIYDCNH